MRFNVSNVAWRATSWTCGQLDLWARATKQQLYEACVDLCRRLHRDVPWLKAEQGGRD